MRTFSVMHDHMLFSVYLSPSRTSGLEKLDSQPGNCRWPLYSSSGVCVWPYMGQSVYSPYHPYCDLRYCFCCCCCVQCFKHGHLPKVKMDRIFNHAASGTWVHFVNPCTLFSLTVCMCVERGLNCWGVSGVR